MRALSASACSKWRTASSNRVIVEATACFGEERNSEQPFAVKWEVFGDERCEPSPSLVNAIELGVEVRAGAADDRPRRICARPVLERGLDLGEPALLTPQHEALELERHTRLVALRSLGELERLLDSLLRGRELARKQAPEGLEPEMHCQLGGLPHLLREPGARRKLGVRGLDLAQLQQRIESKAVALDLSFLVADPLGEIDQLGRDRQTLVRVPRRPPGRID